MANRNNFYSFMKELNKLSEKHNIYIIGNNMIAFTPMENEEFKYKYDPLTLEITLVKKEKEK